MFLPLADGSAKRRIEPLAFEFDVRAENGGHYGDTLRILKRPLCIRRSSGGRFLKDLRSGSGIRPLFRRFRRAGIRQPQAAAGSLPDPRRAARRQVLLYEERLARGAEVVFARDAHGVNSIAFDFAPAFSRRGTVSVVLDLPPLLTRT